MQRWVGVSKTRTLVTGGKSGLQFKSKSPFSWASPERCGLIRDGQRRLRVKVACERRRSQRCNMKSGSHLLRP